MKKKDKTAAQLQLVCQIQIVARPRLPVDHLRFPYYISINRRCKEFFKYRVGGKGDEVFSDLDTMERFRSRIKEMNHTKN